MLVASTGIGTALPGELDTDTTVAVGVGRGAAADDDGSQGTVGRWAGVNVASMGIAHQRLPGNAGADAGDPVAIEIDALYATLLPNLLAMHEFRQIGHLVGLLQHVAGFVGDGGDQELALLQGIKIMLGVLGQGEGCSWRSTAHAALPGVLLHAGIDGLTLVEQHAFAVGRVLPGILAGVVLP